MNKNKQMKKRIKIKLKHNNRIVFNPKDCEENIIKLQESLDWMLNKLIEVSRVPKSYWITDNDKTSFNNDDRWNSFIAKFMEK